MSSWSITAKVGRGGVNNLVDVTKIQSLLNSNSSRMNPFVKLGLDGKVGPKTIAAIEKFQRVVVGYGNPDGRVDPGGNTFRKLVEGQSASGGGTQIPPTVPPTTNPSNGNFAQRVRNFLAHVSTTYGITIPIKSDFRQPAWQNRAHIAHMIKYNSYNSLRPLNSSSVGGRNLISIEHLSNASLAWGGSLQFSDYLRDASNQACRKTPDGRGWINPPDETRTRARSLAILQASGVAMAKNRKTEPSSGMVAPGVTGCIEPCRCGGLRSRHLDGAAVDLGSDDLLRLQSKLSPPTEASVNALLAQFNLHRPIISSEPWHVESL